MAQNAPPDDPARYSVLKKLAAVRSAAGDYADANGYLEMAIRRTEANLGQEDPKIAADLLESVALWRSMKDYGQALAVLSRAMAIHMKPAPFKSAVVADDFSRFAQIQMEYQKSDDAAGSLQTAISIRTHLVGPLDPSLIYDLDRQGTV